MAVDTFLELEGIKGEATDKVPVWQMICRPLDGIRRQARRWSRRLSTMGFTAQVSEGRSTVGGGSLPGTTLPTWWVALSVPSPDSLAEALRHGDPPVIARIEADRLLLDPRTVLPGQERALLKAIHATSDLGA